MWGAWEIADIAVCVILRERGKLAVRKVALLQTKRLYSREIPVAEMERVDYLIGIGRIIDTTDPQFPLSQQRAFAFDDQCIYGAINTSGKQWSASSTTKALRTFLSTTGCTTQCCFPMRTSTPYRLAIRPPARMTWACARLSVDVHEALEPMTEGRSPTVRDLRLTVPLDDDPMSIHGWRLERFIADEGVLRCRQGCLFGQSDDPRLNQLLYARSGPISAAIAITIDFGAGSP